MKTIFIHLAMLGVLTTAAPVVSKAEVPPETHQWEVHHSTELSYNVDYMLFNQKKKQQLGYENRKLGNDVDLDWVGNLGGLFNFKPKASRNVRDHRRGPIPEDADVAIFNTETKRYLTYEKFDNTQAELEWTRTPAYEWQFHDQKKETNVASFALFNSRVKKYLVLQGKVRGIDLGWFDTSPPMSFSVAMTAQQVIQGWVPYLGTFPGFGISTGNLLTVQNASQNVTLFFVKPGKSTINCGDSDATVRVAPAATMTADQMKTLYGSAPPRLPINFLACISTPTPTSITFLNITYKLDP